MGTTKKRKGSSLTMTREMKRPWLTLHNEG
jgi:hypothetical protein